MKRRPIRIDGDVAYVPLTRGLTAIIDAAEAGRVGLYNWCSIIRPTTAYAQTGGFRPPMRLHRFLLRAPAGVQIDHINGDGLDNRLENLRFCNMAQNSHNRRPRNSSGLPCGVRHAYGGAFVATISFKGQTKHLGTFATVEAAIAARYVAELLLFGDFAPETTKRNLKAQFRPAA
jgi:hypothetical protein